MVGGGAPRSRFPESLSLSLPPPRTDPGKQDTVFHVLRVGNGEHIGRFGLVAVLGGSVELEGSETLPGRASDAGLDTLGYFSILLLELGDDLF